MIRNTLANLEAVGLICSDILFTLSLYNWTIKKICSKWLIPSYS